MGLPRVVWEYHHGGLDAHVLLTSVSGYQICICPASYAVC
jgi:hypothetical protein